MEHVIRCFHCQISPSSSFTDAQLYLCVTQSIQGALMSKGQGFTVFSSGRGIYYFYPAPWLLSGYMPLNILMKCLLPTWCHSLRLLPLIREQSLFMAGGRAVQIWKLNALKICPPSELAHYVFASLWILRTEILPPSPIVENTFTCKESRATLACLNRSLGRFLHATIDICWL